MLLSDTRTDLPASPNRKTPEIRGYDVEAESADVAVPPAVERWHADVGERVAISISVVPATSDDD